MKHKTKIWIIINPSCKLHAYPLMRNVHQKSGLLTRVHEQISSDEEWNSAGCEGVWVCEESCCSKKSITNWPTAQSLETKIQDTTVMYGWSSDWVTESDEKLTNTRFVYIPDFVNNNAFSNLFIDWTVFVHDLTLSMVIDD